MLCIIYICVYIHTYLFIHLSRVTSTIVLYVCYLLWNDFMCILSYMIMCMLFSATSTHFKWELMLYSLHCPALNKVFLLLLFLLLPGQTILIFSAMARNVEYTMKRVGGF